MSWLWEAFGLCSRLQIVKIRPRQIIFSTLYFQFEKRFDSDFRFVYMMKSHGILLSDFCGNRGSNDQCLLCVE